MTAITDTQQDTYSTLQENDYSYGCVVTSYSKSGYDPTTGDKTVIETSNPGYIIFKKVSETRSVPKYFEIKAGDKACIFAGNGFEPEVDQKISVTGDKDYKIKLSIDVSSGSKSLFFLIIR